jgi:hypothetical protein
VLGAVSLCDSFFGLGGGLTSLALLLAPGAKIFWKFCVGRGRDEAIDAECDSFALLSNELREDEAEVCGGDSRSSWLCSLSDTDSGSRTVKLVLLPLGEPSPRFN